MDEGDKQLACWDQFPRVAFMPDHIQVVYERIDRRWEEYLDEMTRQKLRGFIRSVKVWTVNDVQRTIGRMWKRNNNLKKSVWDDNLLDRLLSFAFIESFPSPLIGDANGKVLVLWIISSLRVYKRKAPFNYRLPVLRLRYVNWLKGVNSDRCRNGILRQLEQFIVEYLVSLLRSHFKLIYDVKGNALVPYRQILSLQTKAFEEYKDTCQLKAVNDSPTFTLRLLPFCRNIRPICISKTEKNNQCTPFFVCALRKHCERYGVPPQDLSFCRRSLRHYSSTTRNEAFFVKTDIVQCFPSISHHLLLSLLPHVINRDVIVSRFQGFSYQRYRRQFFRFFQSGDSENEITSRVKDRLRKRKITRISVESKVIKKGDLIAVLERTICHNVSYGNVVYSVGRGLPQGSVYSLHLASIAINERIRSIWPTTPRLTLLLRYADDLLLLSHLHHVADHFEKHLIRNHLGISANRKKTKSNVREGKTQTEIKWCGMFINTLRFAVRNHRKISNGKSTSVQSYAVRRT